MEIISFDKPQDELILKPNTRYTQYQFDMVYDHLMSKDWVYNGEVYNLLDYGYTYGYNNNKRRIGVHKGSRQRIELSREFLRQNPNDMAQMEDTIRHEIAHAIDYIIRGKSDHSWRWQRIALAVGSNGKRVSKQLKDPKGKYTLVCPNGHEAQMHRRPKHTRSCTKCNPHRYDERYKFQVIQNY